MHPLFHTFIILLGASTVALTLAIPLAIAWTKSPSRLVRWLVPIQLTFFCVPLYIQAAGWSAGFGALGWWRWTSVDAIWGPVLNHLAVIWIHGAGCLPAVTCWLAIGMRRVPREKEWLALQDAGLPALIRLAWWPALWRWSLASMSYVVATVNSDMLITNLFRVTTLTEQAYLDVSLGHTQAAYLYWASLPALACGLFFSIGIRSELQRLDQEIPATPSHGELLSPRAQRHLSLLVFLIVLATVAVPLFNLGLKAGWDVQPSAGAISRSWSLLRFQEAITKVGEFGSEFYWSFQLGLGGATLALLIAAGVTMLVYRSTQATFIAAAIAVMLLALPGPVVNVVCKRAFESLPAMLSDLVLERTLIAPLIGLQCRCLPMVLLPLLLISHRWYRRHQSNILADGLNGWIRNALWFRSHRRILLIVWLMAFATAWGELACYLLLLPAQVSTVAMRVFELLHYGVRYRESGLCLVSALMGMTAAILLGKWLGNNSQQTNSQQTQLLSTSISRDNRVDLAD